MLIRIREVYINKGMVEMKIYLADNKKLKKYILPSKIEESFLINYKNNNVNNTITIDGETGKWKLKSNGNVNIINGTFVLDEVELTDYSVNFLKMVGQENIIILFSMPTLDVNSYKLNIKDVNTVKIGKSEANQICFKHALMSDFHAEISIENGTFSLNVLDIKTGAYVNNVRVQKTKLNYGDIIFINGLTIIIMKEFIMITNPRNMVSVRGLNAYMEANTNNNTYTPLTEEQKYVQLYDENDYFFHTPRIREKLELKTITIDAPPNNQNREELPFLLTIGTSLTMMASSFYMIFNVYSNVSAGKPIKNYIPQIVMCVAMIFGSLIMPRVTTAYNKRKRKQREKLRQTKYKAYLSQKEGEINAILKKQEMILNDNILNTQKCYDVVMKKNQNFWNREITDNDFLNVRLGNGNVPAHLKIEAPEEHFTLDPDNLFDSVYQVVNNSQELKNVPITLSLTDKNLLSFIFNCTYRDNYFNSLIIQLIALHSGIDLKIVILTNYENTEKWGYMKYLPHCFSDDKTVRFYAENLEDTKKIMSFLDDELKLRKEKLDNAGKENNEYIKKDDGFKNFLPYYLIITDNYKELKTLPSIDTLLREDTNYGFTFIALSDTMKNLPNRCNTFIEIGEKSGCILEKEIDSQSQQEFTNEYLEHLDMTPLCKTLANVPLLGKDALKSLPNSLSFLEMYGVSKIEQLNILNKWKTNNPVLSLTVPVGVHISGEPFKLDLHEKFHGPHGLIAGSTGSGKSEFIITFILSMAINFHPYEVQFVLIDYKGGGLAGAFENKETGIVLPHLVGTITNLDTNEMNRTLVSIESELKRRQKQFNKVKDTLGESTIDIYKYQRLYREGLVNEPMAHLFIISDEFAELKAQQPDFMQQLITTARIGRSLGVHLILATQKPSGVVNDQIWSNSKFKVCLKVQDRSDSMEMLKKPDAASIKETGRFYLQVGYDDYFDIGQSGWGGAKYAPTNKILTKIDDSINFIDSTGVVVKSINDITKVEVTDDLGDQLTNIVKYIYQLSEKENIHTNKLWLNTIPKDIYINDLKTKYSYKPTAYEISPVIGEYDKPDSQQQGLLNVDLTKVGNTIIYGRNGSGKENLLSTIIWSSIIEHTPEEVNLYIIDCGAETLKMFQTMPHVGECVTCDDGEKIVNIFAMLHEEMEKRKDLFADYSGSYINYIQNSGHKLPLLVAIINSYEIFTETYGKLSDAVQTMYRDANKYGIVFVVSATTTNGMRSRTALYFPNKIALQLPDNSDYRSIVNAPRGLFPAKLFGRGLIAKDDGTVEFQTANICESGKLNKFVKAVSEKLNQAYPVKAQKVKTVPPLVSIESVMEGLKGLSQVPIGYDMDTKEIHTYDFTKESIHVILSNIISEKIDFIYGLVRLMSKLPDVQVRVIDFVNIYNKNIEGTQTFKENFDSLFAAIRQEVLQEKDATKKTVYVMTGISQMKRKLNADTQLVCQEIFGHANTYQNTYFIFVDNYNAYKNLQLEPWYQTQINHSNGIWIGEGIASQMAINLVQLDAETRKRDFACMAFAIVEGKFTVIKCVLDEVEEA